MCGICFVCSLSRKISSSVASTSNSLGSADDDGGGDTSKSGIHDFADVHTTFAINHSDSFADILFADPLLHHRGPDVSTKHGFILTEGIHGHMQGCVLHLRGQVTPQPLLDTAGNALMWNGEIFDGIQVTEDENDTQILFDALVKCSDEESILKTIQKVHGPWAFVFWQAEAHKLWFGRDMFGRRSLLWHLPSSNSNHVILSSVALGDMAYTEIPSVGIFCLDFSSGSVDSNHSVTSLPSLVLHPWVDCRWPGTTVFVHQTEEKDLQKYLYPNLSTNLSITIDSRGILDSWIPDIDKSLPGTTPSGFEMADGGSLEDILVRVLESRKDLNLLAEELISVLRGAVEKRVNNLPRDWNCGRNVSSLSSKDGFTANSTHTTYNESVLNDQMGQLSCKDEMISKANIAVLFSGGLDSTVLAALADRCVPAGEPIDLLNVAFEQPVTKTMNNHPKKKAKARHKNTKISGKQSTAASPTNWDGLAVGATAITSGHGIAEENPENLSRPNSDIGTLMNNPASTSNPPANADKMASIEISESTNSVCSSHSHTSDSLDTRLMCSTNTTCDTSTSDTKASFPDPFDVPDRQTGRIALSELNPNRQWNFVEINVTQVELQSLRQSHIRRLIYPLQTVLDDSIGCAVWFAARGHGVLSNDRNQPFISRARVILCGMAADEQFAGYSRHRVTFNTKGWEGLLQEIQEEMWRISARNLGRDDRIITDHGKESRFPFLDETFTKFISTIPLHKRADLRLPRGVGEKLLLRLAAVKLGLVKTASQPKRAIQFGSKIAKLDNRKEKGSDVCDRLTS